jgi:hypothetical protein
MYNSFYAREILLIKTQLYLKWLTFESDVLDIILQYYLGTNIRIINTETSIIEV